MIISAIVSINDKEFEYTYSDKNCYITRDGVRYEEAYDPVGSGREYVETEIPIENE